MTGGLLDQATANRLGSGSAAPHGAAHTVATHDAQAGRSKALHRALLCLLTALPACEPLPRNSERWPLGLRFRAEDPSGWVGDANGSLRSTMGSALVVADLSSPESRLVLTVENPSATPLHVRVGPQSGAAKDVAIGEVRLQTREGRRIEGESSYAPFVPRSLVTVDPQCRAVFYIDAPLGRDPRVGDFVVLLVEVGAPDAKPERRLLPLLTEAPPRKR